MLRSLVGSEMCIRDRLIPCACPMFCFVRLLSAIREVDFLGIWPRRKKIGKTRHEIRIAIREVSLKTRKKNPVSNDLNSVYNRTKYKRCFTKQKRRRRRRRTAKQNLKDAKAEECKQAPIIVSFSLRRILSTKTCLHKNCEYRIPKITFQVFFGYGE